MSTWQKGNSLKIGVAITQGNLCPRFCRYKSDFRTQNYKSGVSQEKKPYERMSQLEKTFLQKSEGFTAYFFFNSLQFP
jgi:hypothetical protein